MVRMIISILYSSRTGTTAEISEVLMAVVEEAGHDVMLESVTSPVAPRQVAAADAVILGSAVYLERWTPEMTNFVEENAEVLQDKPIALFSVGITGEEPRHHVDLEPVAEVLFKGRLTADAGWGDPSVGDQRDWGAIRRWGAEVPAALEAARAGS